MCEWSLLRLVDVRMGKWVCRGQGLVDVRLYKWVCRGQGVGFLPMGGN